MPDVIATARKQRRTLLSEVEAKDLLAEAGIPVARAILAKGQKKAVEAAEAVGYPVVMKIVSPDIAHKSDVGGVTLGLKDAKAVRKAYKEMLERVAARADHQTVAALGAPHAAARSHIGVPDSALLKQARAAHVVLEVGVAAVNDDVVPSEAFGQRGDGLLRGVARRQHHPRDPRRFQPSRERVERIGRLGSLGRERGSRLAVAVVDDALMPTAQKAPHHVAAHAAESDHADLHTAPRGSR